MRLANRVGKLEIRRSARGYCPHLPPLVLYPESELPTVVNELSCSCGLERLYIEVVYISQIEGFQYS